MFCTNCGNNIPDGSNVCENCGATLNTAPESNVTEPTPYYSEPTVDYVDPVQTPAVDPGKTLGMVSMILGIAGLALGAICSCAFACLGGLIPLVLSIVGLVLGIIASKKSKEAGFKNKMATVGIILSIIAIVVILLFIIVNGVLGAVLATAGYSSDIFDIFGGSSYDDYYYDDYYYDYYDYY